MPDPDIVLILFGFGRYGGEIARRLRDRGRRLLAVDFDPSVVESGRKEGIAVCYGDAHDPELLAHLPLDRAEWIVSTAPERDVNLALLSALRLRGYAGAVAVRASDASDAGVLDAAGADLVLEPLRDGAKEAADLLTGTQEDSVEPG